MLSNDAQIVELPYHITMSADPFDDTQEITIPIKGDHPTLGMQFHACPYRHRLQLTNMALSTPGSRIPKWRSVLRKAHLIEFNHQSIHTIEELEAAVAQARKSGVIKATCLFATDRSHGIHPQHGVPQLYFDQLNTIAKHLQDAEREYQQSCVRTAQDKTTAPYTDSRDVPSIVPSTAPSTIFPCTDSILTPAPMDVPSQEPPAEPPPPGIMDVPSREPPAEPSPPGVDSAGTSFTLSQLRKRSDWPAWLESQYKMLNQYRAQGMFSEPMPLPSNSNALRMLWIYLQKHDGTRKSRMVCNGSPRQKGTITLGHTYANSLEAASERLFWAITAQENLIAVGADVSNAFAEAPPPKAPLYMYIDDTYRKWWTEHLGQPQIPADCNVVRVNNAIQGHPESPRLWEKHIHHILTILGLRATTHSPCMYTGMIDGTRILLLRQVDDFAVAAKDVAIATNLIQQINSKMRIQLKVLGIIDRFNGLDR